MYQQSNIYVIEDTLHNHKQYNGAHTTFFKEKRKEYEENVHLKQNLWQLQHCIAT